MRPRQPASEGSQKYLQTGVTERQSVSECFPLPHTCCRYSIGTQGASLGSCLVRLRELTALCTIKYVEKFIINIDLAHRIVILGPDAEATR